jgi:hypothetical protein
MRPHLHIRYRIMSKVGHLKEQPTRPTSGAYAEYLKQNSDTAHFFVGTKRNPFRSELLDTFLETLASTPRS